MHRLGGEKQILAKMNKHNSGEMQLGHRVENSEKLKSIVMQSPYSAYQSQSNLVAGG